MRPPASAEPTRRKRGGAQLVALIALIFCLQQVSQLAVTPLGEGMDFYSHWSYVLFFEDQGRWPAPGELAVPESVHRLREALPAPDHDGARSYADWAGLSPAARADIKARHMYPERPLRYVAENYQAQHPPLYYALASRVYSCLRTRPLDLQRFALSVFSVLLAAAAFPAIFCTFRTLLTREQSLLLLLCVAWFPNLMPFLGRVTNDALAFTLIAGAIWAATKRPQRQLHSALCGLLLVLACFTKTYALAIAPACVMAVVFDLGEPWRLRIRWKNGVVVLLLLGLGLAALFAVNFTTTGHAILLTEARDTDSLSLLQKLGGVFAVSPLWFAGGLAKGFAWCGYWSFVSPGLFFYAPLLLPVILLLYRPREMIQRGDFLGLKALWMHYALLGFFALGMLWHANLFTLRADLLGQTVHSGNEGWYLNVLLPSVLLGLGYLARRRCTGASLFRLLVGAVWLTMLWNAIARIAMYAFWSGGVAVSGRLRAVDLREALSALLQRSSVENWLSCPGIVHPVSLTAWAPLLLSALLSVVVIAQLRRGRA